MPATTPNQICSTRRVLVIDDDHDVADSLVMFLETFGATVRVAYGGAEGLDALEAFKPELVFLDLGMPGMDGYEVARRIRLLPDQQQITIVALTGWGQQEDRRLSSESGFDHHMLKPADIATLKTLFTSISATTPTA